MRVLTATSTRPAPSHPTNSLGCCALLLAFQSFLACLEEHNNDHLPCKSLSKLYLACRMDRREQNRAVFVGRFYPCAYVGCKCLFASWFVPWVFFLLLSGRGRWPGAVHHTPPRPWHVVPLSRQSQGGDQAGLIDVTAATDRGERLNGEETHLLLPCSTCTPVPAHDTPPSTRRPPVPHSQPPCGSLPLWPG